MKSILKCTVFRPHKPTVKTRTNTPEIAATLLRRSHRHFQALSTWTNTKTISRISKISPGTPNPSAVPVAVNTGRNRPDWIDTKRPVTAKSSWNILAARTMYRRLYLSNYNHGQKSLGQSERNFNSMRITSSVAKSSAVFLQIHVLSPLPTQYNVERSKESCLDGFNTVCGVGVGGRDVRC